MVSGIAIEYHVLFSEASNGVLLWVFIHLCKVCFSAVLTIKTKQNSYLL